MFSTISVRASRPVTGYGPVTQAESLLIHVDVVREMASRQCTSIRIRQIVLAAMGLPGDSKYMLGHC